MATKSSIAKIKGIVPIYKKAGISSLTIMQWLQLHIAYEFPMNKIWFKPYIECCRTLEPFASGVFTVGVGRPSFYVKYLQFCDSRYTCDLRMGQSTITDYFKSPLVSGKPFDHVKLNDVEKVCQSFIGKQIQMRPTVFFIHPLGIDEDKTDPQIEDKKQSNHSMSDYLSLENQMRYFIGDQRHHREVTCHSIVITKFDPPDLSLEVNCSHGFSIRSFVKDLFEKLDTCGSFLKLHRIQEGPFTIDHCIDQSDMCLKYLKPALRKNFDPFVDHVRPHLDKLPFYKEHRLNRNC